MPLWPWQASDGPTRSVLIADPRLDESIIEIEAEGREPDPHRPFEPDQKASPGN